LEIDATKFALIVFFSIKNRLVVVNPDLVDVGIIATGDCDHQVKELVIESSDIIITEFATWFLQCVSCNFRLEHAQLRGNAFSSWILIWT